MATQAQLIATLLERRGQTFASELGVDIRRNTASPLFRLLCLALLTGAPVQASIAMRGARALGESGWTTPKKLARSTWQQRVASLNGAGYGRLDEKTATRLAELGDTLRREYNDDLRNLRRRANGDIDAARAGLQVFKGIGKVGANIFLREAQTAWPEYYPLADTPALQSARKLGLPARADELARQVSQADFARLVAALVRTQLAKDFDGVRQTAG